ncbi:MAG: efflux RND transporter periplasmic adaptor subunit [Acidobacteria bacterium]|nr:efflux RND transporter periplasmic adaptor subunit [Acidobacteriota bacterium]
MDEPTAEQEPSLPSKRRWPLLIAGLALLVIVIVAAIIWRRPTKSTGLAGREVPSVESVSRQTAGREVPTVESISGNDVAVPTGKANLTLAPEMVARIKLQFAEVKAQLVANQLRTTGTVQANAYKETRVTPLVGGRVTAVHAQLGDHVKKGQTLATIFSTDLAQEQMEYLKVEANLNLHVTQAERYRKLAEIGAISVQEKQEIEAQLQEHHAEHASHRQRLKLLGLTDAQIDDLKNASNVRAEVTVPSPSSGVITARSVNVGQVVSMPDSLFSVTDLSTVWVMGNIYEKDFGVMRMGAKVLISTPSYPGRQFSGTISYLDPRVDPNTRTAQARIEVANPNQALKIGMFVDVALNTTGTQEALVIPKAALQTVGSDQVVFVHLGGGQFQVRKLQLAEEVGDAVRVVSGVSAGEQVVTEGSFFLRAEMGRRVN